ncbi:glycoside hydrolase family 3 C-terminal domain-containing protein [Anaeroglobus geminatus]|jgi:beta-glucosidase|uniref:Glycosyl hydrolase family 3 protein n=1 Tax=Anaeroglobus geminatus F0357 TaxID=861450 RepID=G9YHH1_9FIRM|nr:glycoside hydrolase family 3 C-terminal domain-containing protein [Anaeroglobus geminatus]EHM40761.1 glycosyl hydrolase family 3 protein [Anaeroglobus geminatus F0357]
MAERNIQDLIKQMTLEEKAGLCSGKDFWNTKAVSRLGIPSVMLSDGPHGLRKQEGKSDHLGLNESIPAVCFPAGCAIASSWDRESAAKLGITLANECQAENVSTILGPAMNIKRSPLCGRNFEYLSEDPIVSSELAIAYVQAVQSKNVVTTPKHFMANNQEFHRMMSDSIMDERTMREIYLASFENMVKQAKPWTMMGAYNKLNGTYLCENKLILTDILRDEWGFDGYIMSDWGAMNDRVDALKAGCELEMPGMTDRTDKELIAAVQSGDLDEELLNRAVERFLTVVFKYVDNRNQEAVFDREADHQVARELAEESSILLKNKDKILPLKTEQKVAFIGQYAKEPRYQGGGSSHINSFKLVSAVEASKELQVTYARGYDDGLDVAVEELEDQAVELAKKSDVAVLFIGLPDRYESEGYDRKHMQLPANQIALLERLSQVQENLVVVLHNGSAVEMPWIDKVKGVLEVYLGGQAVGEATVNLLYGEVNPSGRLAETFPLRLQDTPCYLYYGGENDKSVYHEGVFVGYRYYSSKEMPVLFPFGHGLSYTQFAYDNLVLSQTELTDIDKLLVSVDVTNTGHCYGREVVQVYVAAPNSKIIRPGLELRAFDKIGLEPGETKTVTVELDKRSFAYWDVESHDWFVEEGKYQIIIGRSAEEKILVADVVVSPVKTPRKVFHLNSTIGEVLADKHAGPLFEQMMGKTFVEYTEAQQVTENSQSDAVNAEMMHAMMEGMPLRQLLNFVPGIEKSVLEDLIATLNQ